MGQKSCFDLTEMSFGNAKLIPLDDMIRNKAMVDNLDDEFQDFKQIEPSLK